MSQGEYCGPCGRFVGPAEPCPHITPTRPEGLDFEKAYTGTGLPVPVGVEDVLNAQHRQALDALRAEYAEIVSAVRVTHRYISERGIKPTEVHHANCEIGNWLASLPLPPEPSR